MRLFILGVLLTTLCESGLGQEVPRNGGFEEEVLHWKVQTDGEASAVARTKSAKEDTLGLLVSCPGKEDRILIQGEKVSIEGGKTDILRFWARAISGDGCFVSLRFFDQKGGRMEVSGGLKFQTEITSENREWRRYELYATPPVNAHQVQISIQTTRGHKSKTEFDDFKFSSAMQKSP